MNIYQGINEIIDEVENSLEKDIDYISLSKIIGVNVYTMKMLFALITNVTLAEYVRKRRLTKAGFELLNNKVKIIDIALKYNYNNATSFSRAFCQFHGIKPSSVKEGTTLKNYPKLILDVKDFKLTPMEYKLKQLDKMTFWGNKIKTDNQDIKMSAPKFFLEMKQKYGPVNYAMTTYEDELRDNCNYYYVLYEKNISSFEPITIPASKWLVFPVTSQNACEIQAKIDQFYYEFLPSCNFNLRELPEIEYYHDGITEFLVAIE